MTKARKALWIAIPTAVLLIAAALLLFFLLKPKHQTDGVTVTTELLPVPERVMVSYGNREGVLDAADAEAVHKALLQALRSATQIEVRDGDVHYREGARLLTFAYDDAYRCENGYLRTGSFDKTEVCVYDGSISLDYGFRSVVVTLPREDAFFTLADAAIGRSIGNPVGIPTHTVDAAVVDSPVFAARPDMIVVKGKGGSVQLSAEQADAVYAAFERMNAAREGYIKGPAEVMRCLYTPKNAYEAIDEKSCIEFRYSKRQRYSGVLYQYDPIPEKGQTEPILVEQTVTYDSVLFFPDYGKILGSLNGLYFCLTGPAPNGGFDLGPGHEEFFNTVRVWMPGEEGMP